VYGDIGVFLRGHDLTIIVQQIDFNRVGSGRQGQARKMDARGQGQPAARVRALRHQPGDFHRHGGHGRARIVLVLLPRVLARGFGHLRLDHRARWHVP
jgi:hypothetical protein